MVQPLSQKAAGAYYTPDWVVRCLLNWAVRSDEDRMLDPSCGDGRFIAGHRNAVGIEQDARATQAAIERAPWALVHEGDFFSWAAETSERFECAAGNPPFIRYQTFKGEQRARALALCQKLGANFSGLASSWAPFLAATAGLLKPGGRMAFVVPAEIGHAPYAAPLLDYMVENFATVHVVAVKDKLFPELSEDCWLLYADGYSRRTSQIRLSVVDHFEPSRRPPAPTHTIAVQEWREVWNRRLRPFLLSNYARHVYQDVARDSSIPRLGDLAQVGIGYVSGANDFFHLRPSLADQWDIPEQLLHATVRNGRALPASRLTQGVVSKWKRADDQILLLRLPKGGDLPRGVRKYLETDQGQEARQAYKCRVRDPWYSVPDVQVPDFFLSYMSGREASLVRNDAGCTCTNSVHSVRLRSPGAAKYLDSWGTDFVQLSCEIEGHPLGGGMLKLEPREASQICLPRLASLKRIDKLAVADALQTMRSWRHYAES
ncbi:Eco57I restriction-modification methylase domain-containing protein [Bradyrhizobium sp. DASA03005]|uniref:Eco57I restriction-modification methylase domain-containing protein n=1 Tax=Bradyrhizobium sp. SPXBL-02 TaxID=3395912 RepID=UPI003F6FFABD